MVYLYLRFSIAPLYLAQIFSLHARESARAHTSTHSPIHDPVGCLKGGFLLNSPLSLQSVRFSLFLSIACKVSPARLWLCRCGSCTFVRTVRLNSV